MKTWIPIYFVAYTTRLLATFGSTHPHSTRFPYIFRNSDPNAEIFQISSSEKSTTHFFLVHWDKMMKLPWKKACKNAFDFFERHYNLGQMDKTPRKPLFWKKSWQKLFRCGMLPYYAQMHAHPKHTAYPLSCTKHPVHSSYSCPSIRQKTEYQVSQSRFTQYFTPRQSPKETWGRRLRLNIFHSSFSDKGIWCPEFPTHRCLCLLAV